MKKLILLLCFLAVGGCASMEKRRQEQLDLCLQRSLLEGQQGFAANGHELKIIINSCEGSSDWQQTAYGKKIVAVLDQYN